jgi:hypothetical protein
MGVTVTPSFAQLRNKPTTVAGYGIADMASQSVANAGNATSVNGVAQTAGYSVVGKTISWNSTGGPQVMGDTTTAAMLSLHRASAFAVNFGLDTDNVLKIGGWSMGAVAYPMLYPTATNAPGTAPVFGCRAWLNGNGSSGINGSGNVSSVTDTGVGAITVNFATAMPDTNYAVTATCNGDNWSTTQAFSTGSVEIRFWNQPGVTEDVSQACVAIFR